MSRDFSSRRTVVATAVAVSVALGNFSLAGAIATETNNRVPSLTYNGPANCDPKNGTPGPGDCAQFGTVGQQRTTDKAKNVILFIGDGMGQQEITAARNYLHGAAGRFEGIDNLTSVGAYTHHSINKDGSFNYVTDSAASGTAWATGTKTYNGAIGVDLEGRPVENILEKAKKAGMRTGNVTTAEVLDATPAVVGAHAANRKCYGPEMNKNSWSCRGEAFRSQFRENGGLGSISEQMIDLRPDVTLGGGRKYFDQTVLYEGQGKTAFGEATTTWQANKSVLENAQENGFNVVEDKTALEAVTEANQDKPLLGLFSSGNMTTRFEKSTAMKSGGLYGPTTCTPRVENSEPELVDMTTKAIELLDKKDSDKGFFLQVESASIDKRAHGADACGTIGEVQRLDESVKAALDFAKADGNTLVIVTADHSHATEIIYDDFDSVSAVTRLNTAENGTMSLGYGTGPLNGIMAGGQHHTGSQLRVAAFGPGEENVIGQTDQTDLFFTMANALNINDVPQIDSPTPVPDSATSYQAKAGGNDPVNPANTCISVEADGTVNTEPGSCAQYGKAGQGKDDATAKNVVLFIGDGMGDSEITSARDYLYGANGRLKGIDALPYTGNYTTFSVNTETGKPEYVTDSAASGTGWATGTKTYNGGIAITANGTPVPNLLELAKAKGLKTGNVTTAEIQDATPAVMGSHALNRKCYGPEEEKNSSRCQGEEFKKQYRENGGLGSISEQLIDTRADVTLGGGAKHMNQIVQKGGNWAGHEWKEGVSVVDNAKNQNFQIVTNVDELQAVEKADQDTPVLGLFAPKNMPRLFQQSIPAMNGVVAEALTCEPDPDFTDEQPTLAQMTAKALELLDNEKGFFLQVESASIDKADHGADACGQIGEAFQLDEAVATARDWAVATGEPTLILVTADHGHTSQIVSAGSRTAGRTTRLTTADGDPLTINYATASGNEDERALGGQTHTGTQVRIAAEGPGAANVVGQIDQTDMHYVIANALNLLADNPQIDLTPQWDKEAPKSEDDDQDQTPSKDDDQDQTPSKDDDQDQTPSKDDDQDQTPSKDDSDKQDKPGNDKGSSSQDSKDQSSKEETLAWSLPLALFFLGTLLKVVFDFIVRHYKIHLPWI